MNRPSGPFRGAALVCLLMALVAVAAPIRAQRAESSPMGAWAGWIEVGRNLQPITVQLTGDTASPGVITALLTGRALALATAGLTGQQVVLRVADPRFPVLTGTLDGDTIAGTANAAGGRTGAFRLIRTASLSASDKRRFVGAYRFGDGRMFLVDFGYPEASATLYGIDPQAGSVRAMYPASSTAFVSGPALLVPEPEEQRFTFQMKGSEVVAVVRRLASGMSERADRIPIQIEEVQFASGDARLSGTLLVPPPGSGRHPALVFVPSAGDTAREQYWGLGYLLAARGIAVLAFDKRGTGKSTGAWQGTSFEELADDAIAGARFVQSRAEIDPARVGYWGLSQGAWIAPLAAVRSRDAAFVITMSGGGLTPADGELKDSEYAMRVAGLSDADISEGLAFQQARDAFMRTGENWDGFAARLATAATRSWWRLPGTDLSSPATADDRFWANTRRFYFYDPAPTLRQLEAPLLAIFGALDTPDGVKANVASISSALTATAHPDVTIKVFPNGRHNLMDLTGFPPDEYVRLQRFVPGLFDTMASWLEYHVLRGPQEIRR